MRTLLKALSPRRAVIRPCALAVASVAVVLMAVALIWPDYWNVGRFRISLHTTRNLALVAELAIVVWIAAAPRTARLLAVVRQKLSLPRQALAVLLIVNGLFALYVFLTYPQTLTDTFRSAREDLAESKQIRYGHAFVPLDNFAARCSADLPTDARILYHGLQEGWVFAYDVYPRRVFMLPSDWRRLAASCHLKPWFSYLPQDPLEPYWHQTAAALPDERETFIRDHHITHEVFFDAQNPAACRWEVVR